MEDKKKTVLDLGKILKYDRLTHRQRKIISGACVVIFIFASVSFLKGHFTRPKKAVVYARQVDAGEVVKKDVPVYVEAFGTLAPLCDVNIQAQVTGQLEEIHFQEGDEVKKGDLLFVVDPRQYKADLQKAEAVLAEDLVDLKMKKDTLERNRSLLDKNLVSKQTFEQYQTDVAAAEAKVKLDTANVELAKINLEYCYIKAPMDGRTGRHLVDPGNIVSANAGPTLVNIKTDDTLYVDFNLSERDLSEVRKAMSAGTLKVEIKVEGDKGGPYSGDLSFVNNTVDELTGTILLRAIVPNGEGLLWPGQFVRAKLILDIDKDALLAPYAAVRIGQKGPYLFAVSSDSTADLRLVNTGLRQGDYITVDKGVEEGEMVVTSGQLGLSPGVPLRVVPAGKKTAAPDPDKSGNDK